MNAVTTSRFESANSPPVRANRPIPKTVYPQTVELSFRANACQSAVPTFALDWHADCFGSHSTSEELA